MYPSRRFVYIVDRDEEGARVNLSRRWSIVSHLPSHASTVAICAEKALEELISKANAYVQVLQAFTEASTGFGAKVIEVQARLGEDSLGYDELLRGQYRSRYERLAVGLGELMETGQDLQKAAQ